MFLNCNGLNYSTIFTGNNIILDKLSNYDSVEIYGGSDGCIIDKLWGRNIPLSVSTIQHYNSDNYIPKWTTGETYMLAEYNNELDAGNVKGYIHFQKPDVAGLRRAAARRRGLLRHGGRRQQGQHAGGHKKCDQSFLDALFHLSSLLMICSGVL